VRHEFDFSVEHVHELLAVVLAQLAPVERLRLHLHVLRMKSSIRESARKA
jgi:hypothetical protein